MVILCVAHISRVLRRYSVYNKYSRGEFIKLSDFTLLPPPSLPPSHPFAPEIQTPIYFRNSTTKFNHKFTRCWRTEFCAFSRDLFRKLHDENGTIKRRVVVARVKFTRFVVHKYRFVTVPATTVYPDHHSWKFRSESVTSFCCHLPSMLCNVVILYRYLYENVNIFQTHSSRF